MSKFGLPNKSKGCKKILLEESWAYSQALEKSQKWATHSLAIESFFYLSLLKNHKSIGYNSCLHLVCWRHSRKWWVGICSRLQKKTKTKPYKEKWRKVSPDVKETLWTHFEKNLKLSFKAKPQVLKWMWVALRAFRCKLTNEYILLKANNLNSLKKPRIEYEGIRKEDWKSFVDKVLSEDFQVAKDKEAKNVYNHHLGSTGYAKLFHKRKLELRVSEREINRTEAGYWLKRKKMVVIPMKYRRWLRE